MPPVAPSKSAERLTALRLGAGVSLDDLTPEARERLYVLDKVLHSRGVRGTITSGKRAQDGTKSHHHSGNAIDFVVGSGNMAGLARDLAGLGYRAQFETKGQRNPNGSVATGDHIHVTLLSGPRMGAATDPYALYRKPAAAPAAKSDPYAIYRQAAKPAPAQAAAGNDPYAIYRKTATPAPAQENPLLRAGRTAWRGLAAVRNATAIGMQDIVRRSQMSPEGLQGYLQIPENVIQGARTGAHALLDRGLNVPDTPAPNIVGDVLQRVTGRQPREGTIPRLFVNMANEVAMPDPTELVAGPAAALIGKGVRKATAPARAAIAERRAAKAAVEAHGATVAEASGKVRRMTAKERKAAERLARLKERAKEKGVELAEARDLADIAAQQRRLAKAEAGLQAVQGKIGKAVETADARSAEAATAKERLRSANRGQANAVQLERQDALIRGWEKLEKRAEAANKQAAALQPKLDAAAARFTATQEALDRATEALAAARAQKRPPAEIAHAQERVTRLRLRKDRESGEYLRLSREQERWTREARTASDAAGRVAERVDALQIGPDTPVGPAQRRALANRAREARSRQFRSERQWESLEAQAARLEKERKAAQQRLAGIAAPDLPKSPGLIVGAKQRSLANLQQRAALGEKVLQGRVQARQRAEEQVATLMKQKPVLPPAKGVQKVSDVIDRAYESALGQKIGGKLAEIGIGPEFQKLREVRRPYQLGIERREHAAGQLVAQMRKWSEKEMLGSPDKERIWKEYAESHGGASPLENLVKLWVAGRAPGARSDVVEGAIKHGAKEYGIPEKVIAGYGQRVLDHIQETVKIDELAGGKLGKNFQTPEAEQKFWKRYYAQNLNNIFRTTRERRAGEPGFTSFAGGGNVHLRRAHLRELEDKLVNEAKYVQPVVAGKVKPGWKQFPMDVKEWGRLAGKQAPEIVHRFLDEQKKETGKVLTKLGRSLESIGDEAQPAWKRNWQKLVGIQKAVWLTGSGTIIGNTWSNHRIAGIGLTMNGLSPASLLPEAGKAFWELVRSRYVARDSEAMQRLGKHSRALLTTMASSAGAGRPGSRAAISGMQNRVVRPPVGKPFLLPPPGEMLAKVARSPNELFGLIEQSYKLAMFKLLEPKLGAKGAAEQVERFLFDYSDRGKLPEALDRNGLWIFNYWPTHTQKLVLEMLVQRPDLLAKHDRFRRLTFQQNPGAEESGQTDPEFRKGSGVLAVNKDTKVDLSRMIGFADALDNAKKVARGEFRNLIPSGEDVLKANIAYKDLMPILHAMNVIADDPVGLGGLSPARKKVAHPGAPKEQQIKNLIEELTFNVMPPTFRSVRRWLDAKAGRPSSDYPLDEAQTPGQAALQGFVGIPAWRSGSDLERAQRLLPQLKGEAREKGRYVTGLLRDLRSGARKNPFVIKTTDPERLEKMEKATAEYFRRLMGSRRFDRERTADALALLLAIGQRRVELVRGGRK